MVANANETSPLATWAETVRSATADLESAAARFRDFARLPPGGAPEDRLAILLRLWDSFVRVDELNPVTEAARRLGLTVEALRRGIEPAFLACMAVVEAEVSRHLEAGLQAPGSPVVVSKDFGHVLVITDKDRGGVVMAAGIVATLAEGHWLRERVQGHDLYLHEGRPSLILGLCSRNRQNEPYPRRWYPLASVLQLTEATRARQLAEEAEKARERAEREELRQRERLSSPAGQAAQLADARKRIEQLEAERGKASQADKRSK